jgi:hypothetical protein
LGSAAAVRAPRSGQDEIHIVLKENARKWDDMVHVVDTRLPALISRDIASLKVVDGQGGVKQLGDATNPLVKSRLTSEAHSGYIGE